MIDPRLLRDDPDRVRAAQAKRGLSADVVDRALAADSARRQAIADFESKRAEQKASGALVAKAQGEEKQALLAAGQGARRRGEGRRGRPQRAPRPRGTRRSRPSPTSPTTPRPPVARTTTPSSSTSARPASSTSSRATTSSSAGCSAPSTSSAAPRSAARASTSSPASARSSSWRWSTWRWTRPATAGFIQVIAPSLVKPRAMEGTGFLGQAADDVYRIEGEDLYLVGTCEVAMAAFHSDEILDAASLPLRYAAFSPCFRKEAGSPRQGHQGHHPGPLVRQGRDVRLHDRRGVVRRAPAAAGVGEGVPRQARARLPRHRRRRRRPGPERRAQVRLRGVDPDRQGYGELTSTSNCTDFQARRLDIRTRGEGGATPGRHPQRHAHRRHPRDRRDPGDPPERGRLGHRAAGAAALPRRPGSDEAPLASAPLADDWRPGSSRSTSTAPCSSGSTGRPRTTRPSPQPVYDAVHRALDAGAHIVLSSGRSPARDDPDRRPARHPARGGRPAVGRRLQRRGGLPLPADGGRPRGDLRRRAGRRRRAGAPPARARRRRGARGRRLPRQPGLPRGRDLRRADHHRGPRHRRRAGEPRDHPRPRGHRRRLRRARREARPARHRLRRRLDGVDGPLPGRRLEGLGPPARLRRSSASPRPTCSRSATAATTSRCCAGPVAAWRWARPSTRSRRPPTTSPPPSTTRARPSRCRAGSRWRPEPVDEGFTFTAPLWRWTARRESADSSSWCFVTLPPDVADEVRDGSGEPRGFGSVRVRVTGRRHDLGHQRLPRLRLRQLRAAGEEGRPHRGRRRGGRRADRHPVAPGPRLSAPRLVATDLDGTLLHSDGTVTARTRAVLDELDARGVPVVFTTGRPIRWMEDLWDDVGGHGLAICSNGGIVYDVARREVRDFRAVPREVGVAVAEQLRSGRARHPLRGRAHHRLGERGRLPAPPRRPTPSAAAATSPTSSATTW